MTNFTNEQLAAAALAAEIARLVVLRQWMPRNEAEATEQQIVALRQRQLDIETSIEMADLA